MEQLNCLRVKIVSAEGTLYDGKAYRVTIPGTKGEFEVLPNHAPIISSLTNGVIQCFSDSSITLSITGGFVEVRDNCVTLCVETAE